VQVYRRGVQSGLQIRRRFDSLADVIRLYAVLRIWLHPVRDRVVALVRSPTGADRLDRVR